MISAKKKSGKKTPGKTQKGARAKPRTGKKVGTPSKYNPDQHPFMAWALAIRGRTNKEIAAGLSISTGTLHAWSRSHPEFLSSLKAGKDVADAKVENSLFIRAFGYEYEEVKTKEEDGFTRTEKTVKHVPGDTTAMIFWLKNRRPGDWKDKREHVVGGEDGKPVAIKVLRGVSMEDL
jgi:hypothetical protein